MRIVHVTDYYKPVLGGVQRHVDRVTQALACRGHRVTVVAGDRLGPLPAWEQDGLVLLLRFPATRSRARAHLWFLRNARMLWVADVIHVHAPTLFSFLPALIAPKRKVVYTAHGWSGRYPIPAASMELTRRCAARAGRLVCIGDFIGKWYGVAPDAVSYGAVEVRRDGLPARVPGQVCMLGRLFADTGIYAFGEGLRRLAASGRRLRVVVCGDGPERPWLEEILRYPGIEAEFLGFVADPEAVVAASAVTLSSGYLGMLECMALGSPVVAVADNPVKEDYLSLSPMARYISIARSPEEVAGAVEAALESRDSRLAEAAREFALGQTWDKVADTYEGLYQSLRGSRQVGVSPPVARA